MDTLWLSNPSIAYSDWQAREAAGADRRPFSARSIVQHQAMFEHFLRHLKACGTSLDSFGEDHLASFWSKDHSEATRMRYLKLLDRVCRHLVFIGVRRTNPAEALARAGHWPVVDPEPIFLPEDVDARLQAFVQLRAADDLPSMRNRAIVALLLGTGVTAGEFRGIRTADLEPSAHPPYLHVPAHGPRDARTVHVEAFAIAPIAGWAHRRPALDISGDLLFSLQKSGLPMNDMSLGKIVRAVLEAIAFEADDMSPRVLRNTYCRRQLLAGVDRDTVSQRMGLTSNRTADRIAATLPD